ncbi:competence type IV pilus minor pilin ComGG [Calidifontibacillus erzurumensis]|uniref:ComG operon protein 7 (ComGG) n=1 Tax=Calidifontibacillus erzurumensis TaxID=2741433 RepID=A0A8J8GEE6_9BACI|nr:competence type IV pilus minor pilin ComGG [Calidifontibacillus erzurumensis]NSL50356.1 hypothetical protein [Calidifontibacillus erzurumensis]
MYGILNQRGFILPTTLVICLLIPLIILSEIELYKTEKLFVMEEEEGEKLQNLTQIGVQHLFKISEEQEQKTTTGTIYYPIGMIQYTIEKLEEDMRRINGTCITDKKRKLFFVAIVNVKTKEIVHWVEG